MDEDIPSWDILPPEVDAVVTNDGEEFLSNADADSQNGENFYGQNQTLAGKSSWWDDNYPGQTVQNPNAVTENVFDPRQEVQESVFNPAAAVPDPYLGLTPAQIQNLGGADPTDPFIRARLGIPQLPDSPLSNLPSNSNFFNSLKNVATSVTGTVQKAVSALTTKSPTSSPYPSASPVRTVPVSRSAAPVTDEFGLTILNDQQTNQLVSGIDPALRNGLVAPPAVADDGTVVVRPPPYEDNGQLSPGWELDEQNNPVYVGGADPQPTVYAPEPTNTEEGNNVSVFPDPNGSGGFVDIAGNPVNADGSPIGPAATQTFGPTDPYAGLTPDQLKALGNADPTDPYIRARLGIPQLPGSPLSTSQANLGDFLTKAAAAVGIGNTGFTTTTTGATAPFFGSNPDAEAEAAVAAQVGRQLAQQQAVTAAQKKLVNNGDWRVRLSLAPGARYLYNDPNPGILQPLAATDGIVFPYTPKIDMAYKADYDQYTLTHSNYKGYFYKSSYADAVQLHAVFTAQDSAEADYLLAVIHFFRSVTKMFYGQDPQRGAPPPLVYLTGLGQYQFAAHPCAVASFSYSLPENVDYIRARSININGTNMLTRRDKQDLPSNPISGAVSRLQNLFNSQKINFGAEINRPAPPTLGQNQPTYVPTRMEINITLNPMQSRQQVSQQFSLRGYANGDLLKRGFW